MSVNKSVPATTFVARLMIVPILTAARSGRICSALPRDTNELHIHIVAYSLTLIFWEIGLDALEVSASELE